MESIDLWLVTWKHDYRTHCLDAETQDIAESIAIRLAEDMRRTDVMLLKREFQPDPEQMAAVKARVWKSVRAHAMGEAMREAAG